MKTGLFVCSAALLLLPAGLTAHNMEPALRSANQEIRELREAIYTLQREVEALKKMMRLQNGEAPESAVTPASPPAVPAPVKKTRPRTVRKPKAGNHSTEVNFPELLSVINRMTAHYHHTSDLRDKVKRLNEIAADTRDALHGKKIVLNCTIRDARPMGNGIAEIWIEPPPEIQMNHLENQYISVTPFKWIRVKMSEAQSMNLRSGETLELYGKALFFPKRKGDIGLSTNTQQLFTIHILNSANAIGTVTLQDYKAAIGLLTFPGL